MPAEPDGIAEQIRSLGHWFQNMELRGVATAPAHPLGDYPRVKWQRFSHALPADLTGKSVLEIGCNAGFYCFELKKRGAERVLGLDTDAAYLQQASFARQTLGLEVEFREMSVYDVGDLKETFDLVLFLGVLYHLRYPLLALDLIREHVAKDTFVIQSMLRGSQIISPLEEDYTFWQTDQFLLESYPKLHFVEQRYASDPTNWWIPNRACLEGMIRSAGFQIDAHPEEEVYVCHSVDISRYDDRSCRLLERTE